MIHAYDEVLKEEAADKLGKMLDFAVHSLHMDAANMLALFAASGTSALFERGDIRTIIGMSGIELAYDVLERCGISYERTPARHTRGLSAEYYLGYCIAVIQYRLSVPFSEMIRDFSCQNFLSGYAAQRTEYLSSLPLTVSSEDRRIGLLDFGKKYTDEAIGSYFVGRNTSASNTGELLKNARIKNGLSQSALAKAAGVPLRTLQQYEQGQKDIGKARAEYIIALASVLNTEPSKLIHLHRSSSE
jgi:DNA-binding XRE family transcriptional regulator